MQDRLDRLGFWRLDAIQLQDVLFADDMVIVAETNVNEYEKELSAINLEININKSKTMAIVNETKEHKIKFKGQLLIRTSQRLQISGNTDRMQC